VHEADANFSAVKKTTGKEKRTKTIYKDPSDHPICHNLTKTTKPAQTHSSKKVQCCCNHSF